MKTIDFSEKLKIKQENKKFIGKLIDKFTEEGLIGCNGEYTKEDANLLISAVKMQLIIEKTKIKRG